MKAIRLISKILRVAAAVLAGVYGLSFAYSFLVLLLNALFPAASWLPIEVLDDRFVILFPFTKIGFLTERLHWGYQLFVLVILLAYAVFFWLLGCIFSAFSDERIFTQTAVQALGYFSRASLSVPIAIFIFYAIVTMDARMGEALLAMVHWLLGIFTLFLAAIFREGYQLQQEQDLTI